MDRVRGRGFSALVVAFTVAMLPGMALAAADCINGGYVALVADGRIEEAEILNTADAQAGFNVKMGRSYCFELHQPDWGNSVDLEYITYGINNCVTTSSPDWISQTMVEPPGYAFRRVCGIASQGGQVTVRISNSSATLTHAHLNATETTLFNPRWSTYNGFLSSWGFTNTTNTQLNGVLTVNDGTTDYTMSLTLMANKLTYVFSSQTFDQGLIGADKAGSAMFAHNGPPGSILADCYYAKSGVMIPSSFVPVRENRH